MNIKVKLSTLWVIVCLNIIMADILSIFIGLVHKNTLDIIGEVKTTMAVAAILLNIPILMIFFSRVLNYRKNRILNIIASCVTLLFVVGGGSLLAHYLICALIEAVVLLYIIKTAWNWVENKNM